MNTVFISGAISSRDYTHAFHHFVRLEKRFLNSGYNVWNPMRNCNVNWSWLRCMIVCLYNLAKYDAVIFLEGWENSLGSNIEYRVAKLLGKELIFE